MLKLLTFVDNHMQAFWAVPALCFVAAIVLICLAVSRNRDAAHAVRGPGTPGASAQPAAWKRPRA